MNLKNVKNIVKKLEGIQTVETIMSLLDVNRQGAIHIVYMLRKEGYVKTQRSLSKKRVYNISFENKQGGISYYDIINEHSPKGLKVNAPRVYKIYGRDVTLEETLIFAVKSKKIRLILASLSLFRTISDWSELYRLAKLNKLIREVGALYDLSKKKMRVRRMDGRFRRLMLPSEKDSYRYIIDGYKTNNDEIKEIEKKWKVFIPFNKDDLEYYNRSSE